MISDLERSQRLRDIEERLLELTRNRALLDDVANTPDHNLDRSRVDAEINRLRSERQVLQEPGALLIWDRVNDMWKLVLDMQADARAFRRLMTGWLAALSVLMALVLAVVLVRL